MTQRMNRDDNYSTKEGTAIEAIHQHVDQLLTVLERLRYEIDERIRVRETLIEQIHILGRYKAELLTAGYAGAADQSDVRSEESLPLLFQTTPCPVSKEWDSYLLESELLTEGPLDAAKVTGLVSGLPGLNGCLIVKNRGSVLASNLPETLHDFLKVPNRAYGLVFSRLPGQIDQHVHRNGRIATFNLGQRCLTAVQANHLFLFASHAQAELRPGISEKLLAVTSELSKMYPA
jgi:hypothetical protein